MNTTSPRSTYEIKKLADWWLTLSKIILGSLVIQLFEPGDVITYKGILVAIVGLTLGIIFARVGLKIARKVKDL